MSERAPKPPAPDPDAAPGHPQGSEPESGKKKKKKRPFMQGVRERLTSMYGLGRTLVTEPRSFPAELKHHLLEWARATWNARGGGFYACGFVVTFLYLELKLLLTELFTDTGDFILEQAFQLLFRFTVDSLVNTLLALLWPALLLGRFPVYGLAFLGAGYFLFNRFLKAPLTRRLFDDRHGDRHGTSIDDR